MFEFPDDDIDLELSARHKRIEDEDEDSAEVKEKGLNAVNLMIKYSLTDCLRLCKKHIIK